MSVKLTFLWVPAVPLNFYDSITWWFYIWLLCNYWIDCLSPQTEKSISVQNTQHLSEKKHPTCHYKTWLRFDCKGTCVWTKSLKYKSINQILAYHLNDWLMVMTDDCSTLMPETLSGVKTVFCLADKKKCFSVYRSDYVLSPEVISLSLFVWDEFWNWNGGLVFVFFFCFTVSLTLLWMWYLVSRTVPPITSACILFFVALNVFLCWSFGGQQIYVAAATCY